MKRFIISGFIVLLFITPDKCFAAQLPLNIEFTDLYNEKYYLKPVFSEANLIKLSKESVSTNYYVTDDDIYLMAQIVYAESRSEPFEGKVAVASVILNRLDHSDFPKTIKEVITQKEAFSCVKNGRIDVIPDESSYSAVREALKGTDPTLKAVFFYNPKISTSKWMVSVQKDNKKTIGNHVFFAIN